jgi:aminoglycoside phosphotransferase (APT) family kinase protein
MGREIFSYLEGEVPAELGLFDDPVLRAGAVLIRRFHDLAAELVVGTAETVCHNDLSPCNFVFRDGSPVALIDFDATSPGSRAHDLGYAAWLWLNFGISELPPSEQRRRLWLFTDAYGGMDNHVVIHSMMQRQKALAEEGRRQGNRPMASWAAACLKWTRCHQSELTQS